jgi:redox-sensitive bicupin YhaK (pirin superfamily)
LPGSLLVAQADPRRGPAAHAIGVDLHRSPLKRRRYYTAYNADMLLIRRSDDRGRANHGWLDSRHTFSFADYHDPRFMGYGPLRVINEDRVQAGQGFGRHSHRDMEIISYVLEGELAHEDSMGNGSVIRRGDVQRMSAGTGVEHSEFNHSKTNPVHFFQIWVIPARRGMPPSYEEKHFDDDAKRGRLRLVASQDGREGSVVVHQDANLYAALLGAGDEVTLTTERTRKGWVQLASGAVTVNGEQLAAGDGAAVAYEDAIAIRASADTELLLFDMA